MNDYIGAETVSTYSFLVDFFSQTALDIEKGTDIDTFLENNKVNLHQYIATRIDEDLLWQAYRYGVHIAESK